MAHTPDDPYVDAVSGVLRNMLDINEGDELARREAEITTIRDAQLVIEPVAGNFGPKHVRAIHQALFGDLYDWAGELRTVDIDKGIPFAKAEWIQQTLMDLQETIRGYGYLHELSRDEVVDALTKIYGDLNACHPFREGNGRTQRAFVRQLAAEAGWQLHWSHAAADDNDRASARDLSGDSAQLRSMIDAILAPLKLT